MDNPLVLVIALAALVIGLAAGKAWERYKLEEGRWIDRRKARESPHYILGLNFLVANQIDLAIEELGKAARLDTDALEIDLILGNLYREKGQVGRAIQVHQSLLQRPKLTKLQHAYVLLCLGLDYKRGGFVDRAFEAFNEVLRLDPPNHYALVNLQKLHEEQHQWDEAAAVRQRLAATPEGRRDGGHEGILAFLENARGLETLRRTDYVEAARRFEAAIALDDRAVPAYLNLGDVRVHEGRLEDAARIWERVVAIAPERAYLAFDRFASVYSTLGAPHRFEDLCRRIIAASPLEWRARLALGRHLAARGAATDAIELLFDALVHNPHALTVHQAIWHTLSQLNLPGGLVSRYVDLTRDSVFYLDPHLCLRCRYRSTELLWQCPQCHEWNTFIEERMTPAKDEEEVPV